MTQAYLTATDGNSLIVDADALPILGRHRWYPVPIEGGQAAYAAKIGKATVYLSHMVYGSWKRDGIISFLDKDPKNCQRENLVALDVSTWRHRASQKKRSRKTTSEYRGVIVDPRTGRSRARCRGKYLGTFDEQIDAAKAYDSSARIIYGEKAVVNFPEYTRPLTP